MSIDLSDEQRQAVQRGEPVQLHDPEMGGEFILIRAQEFDRLVEEATEIATHRAWLKEASRTRRRWVSENPY